MGIRSLAEAAEYETTKRKKESAATASSSAGKRGGAGSGVGGYGGTGAGGLAGTLNLEGSLSSNLAWAGITTGAVGASTIGGATGKNSSSAHAGKSSLGVESGSGGRSRSRRGDDSTALGSDAHARQEHLPPGNNSSTLLQRAADAFVAKSNQEGTGGSSSSSSGSSEGKPKFCVVGMPGAENLSEKEKTLCEHLSLSPLQYQQIKSTVINISLVRGIVKKGDVAARLVHVDVAKIAGVYDLVVQAGYANGAS